METIRVGRVEGGWPLTVYQDPKVGKEGMEADLFTQFPKGAKSNFLSEGAGCWDSDSAPHKAMFVLPLTDSNWQLGTVATSGIYISIHMLRDKCEQHKMTDDPPVFVFPDCQHPSYANNI